MLLVFALTQQLMMLRVLVLPSIIRLFISLLLGADEVVVVDVVVDDDV